MKKPRVQEPWERLAALIAARDPARIRRFLKVLPGSELPRSLSRIASKARASLLSLLGPEESAELLGNLPDAQAVKVIEDMEPDQAAAIIEELPSAERADLLGELDDAEANAILDQMPEAEASEARLLLQYPADTAGGVMITEFVSYPDHVTVEDVVEDLWAYGEHYSDYEIQYAYITDGDGVLSGVLRLRDLLLAQRQIPVGTS